MWWWVLMGLHRGGCGPVVIGSRRCLSLSLSDHRCRVVVRAVSFGGRLHIRNAHAMQEVPPVLMRMHDA